MPEEDTQLTPATRLLAKRREMAEVEAELVNSKEVRTPSTSSTTHHV